MREMTRYVGDFLFLMFCCQRKLEQDHNSFHFVSKFTLLSFHFEFDYLKHRNQKDNKANRFVYRCKNTKYQRVNILAIFNSLPYNLV